MSLLRFDQVSLEFGEQKILTAADFSIEPGERVCLLGRNGVGKSTTLKLINGEIDFDKGDMTKMAHLVISQLAQNLPEAMNQRVSDVVRSGLADIEALIQEYQRQSELKLDKQGLKELEALHARVDARDGWHIDQRVETTITELKLPADRRANLANFDQDFPKFD